jgi:hypothetical protein
MAKKDEHYSSVVVESYLPTNTSGRHGPVHIRPLPGQGFDTGLHVECSKSLSYDYPVGTRFRLKVKLTDREGGGEFLYSHFRWPFEVLD